LTDNSWLFGWCQWQQFGKTEAAIASNSKIHDNQKNGVNITDKGQTN
jgi:hypothetical protein